MNGRRPDRVMIVATGHGGHRLVYVRLLAEAVVERGGEVVLALTPAAVDSPEYRMHLTEVAARCSVVSLDRATLSVSALRRLGSAHGGDRILVPEGDRLAMRVGLSGWRGPAELVVLVTQDPRWNTDRRLALRARLAVKDLILWRTQLLPRVRLLYLADHALVSAVERRRVAPDPVLFDAAHLDRAELRRRLGLAEDRFWFLVVGNIPPRKNLPMVIEALGTLPLGRAALYVCGALLGPVRQQIQPALAAAERAGALIVIDDRAHTDHEINQAVQAVDCVVVAYSSDQPNSTMAKGARAGRRVVVAGSSSLRRWAANLGIELTGPLDQRSLNGLLHRALGTSPPVPQQHLDHRPFVRAFL